VNAKGAALNLAGNSIPIGSIAATFETLPGASFVVHGAAQAHDAALTTASAEPV
jgi:hypothetical protein